MKAYSLLFTGYECSTVRFPSIKEAKKELMEILQDDLKDCKSRYPKGAPKLHRFEKSGRVTMGRDIDSTIWSQGAIVEI